MERSGEERVTRSDRRASESTALDLSEIPHEYRSFPTAVKVKPFGRRPLSPLYRLLVCGRDVRPLGDVVDVPAALEHIESVLGITVSEALISDEDCSGVVFREALILIT